MFFINSVDNCRVILQLFHISFFKVSLGAERGKTGKKQRWAGRMSPETFVKLYALETSYPVIPPNLVFSASNEKLHFPYQFFFHSETFFFLLCFTGWKKAIKPSWLFFDKWSSFQLPAPISQFAFSHSLYCLEPEADRTILLWLYPPQKFPWYPHIHAMPPKNPVMKGASLSLLACHATSCLCVIDKLL